MGQHETFDSTYAKRMDSVNHSVGPFEWLPDSIQPSSILSDSVSQARPLIQAGRLMADPQETPPLEQRMAPQLLLGASPG